MILTLLKCFLARSDITPQNSTHFPQIGQFLDDRGRYKHRFWIHEQKRNKRHEVVVNQSTREALEEYLDAYPGVSENSGYFVFFNTRTNGYSEPIKRGQAQFAIRVDRNQAESLFG
jgi:hypothetical protein